MRKYLFFIAVLLMPLSASAQKASRGKIGGNEPTVVTKFEDNQARAFDVMPSFYVVKPISVELKVNESGRITDVWEISLEDLAGLTSTTSDFEMQLQNLRNYAIFKSTQKHGCDMIVAPTFSIQAKDLMTQGVTVTIVGYQANFVNWKTMDETDLKWVNMEKVEAYGQE